MCLFLFSFALQLERRDVGAAQSLRSSILKTEQNNPGFCYDFIMAIVRRAELNVNLNECVLRLQGNLPETDCKKCDWMAHLKTMSLMLYVFF